MNNPIQSDPVQSNPDFVDASFFTSLKVTLGYFWLF